MENNKYYQPNSEDFNIGVECQVYYPREEVWKDRKIRHWEDLDEILSRFVTDSTSVKFKYLDEEDILDCGFTQISNDCFNLPIKEYRGRLNQEIRILVRQTILIYLAMYSNDKDNLVLFTGHIKNKNELQRILKQVVVYGN